MGAVAQLWRHPIKSHGRESLDRISLSEGRCVPMDRHWAVVHEKSKFDGSGWARCANFMIGARTPALAGIWAELDEATKTLTLRHQDLPDLRFQPDHEEAAFLEWVAPLCPTNRALPSGIVSLPDRGMTDSDYPSVSIMNIASHDAVAAVVGGPLEQERWRGNIWVDGLPAWHEDTWIGKTLQIGGAQLEVREPIERCMHTASNPKTGLRDADTLGALKNFGHQNFGVYAVVTSAGDIALGDECEVL